MGVYLGHAYLFRHFFSPCTAVSRQHYRPRDPQGFQLRDGLFRFGAELIADLYPAEIFPVPSHVNERIRAVGLGCLHAVFPQKSGVSDQDGFAFDLRGNAPARKLADIFRRIGRFYILKSLGNRVGRTFFRCGGDCKDFFFRYARGDPSTADRKISFRQRTRLIEGDRTYFCGGVEIRRTLDQDTVTGTASDTAEIGERNGNNQRAGTGNNEESKRRLYPAGEISSVAAAVDKPEENGDEHRDRRGQAAHDRRIVTREFSDKLFGRRLSGSGIFHQIENLRHGAVLVGAHDLHFENAPRIDTARQQLVALVCLA